MNRKQVLIAAVGVLGVSLATVVTGIVTGFLPTGAGAGPPPPAAAPAAGSPAGEPVPPAGDEQARYVGASEDGTFTVAVHVWENSAIAHVTDGVRRETWVKGTSGGDRLLLAGAGGAVLDAEVTDDGKLTGTAEFGAGTVAFAAPAVTAPAGIYRAAGEVGGQRVRVGMIVLPDRRAAGIEWVDGEPGSAPPADLTGRSVRVAGGELRLEAIRPGDV
jgi:hypothetical protein